MLQFLMWFDFWYYKKIYILGVYYVHLKWCIYTVILLYMHDTYIFDNLSTVYDMYIVWYEIY